MKIRIFLFFFMTVFAISLPAQEFIYNAVLKDSLFYTYDENDELCFDNNFNCYFLENTEEPALPYYNFYIDIPSEYEFINYDYNITASIVLTGIHISPNPRHYNYNDSIINQDHCIEYNDSVYPSNVLSYINTYKGRNEKKISFRFSPFIYNNYDSLLYNVESIELTINFKNGHSIIKQYGNNSDDLLEHTPHSSNENFKELVENFNPNDSIEYLVITSNDFVDAFKPLVEWKTLKGVPAKISSVDSIYNMYEGISNEIKIKRYIKELYEKTNKRLKFVLLGGDDRIVPVKYCRVAKLSADNDTIYKSDVPTDIFYGCFDGDFLWDANNDGVSGDVDNDSVDYFPEVYVSRFPARTISHVNAMIYKTLSYEKNPPTGNWCYDILNIGCRIARKNDAEYKSDTISKYTFKRYLNNPNIFKFFDSNTSYLNGKDYDLNPNNLQKELSKGYHFVNEYSHGQKTHWIISDTETNKYDTSYASILSSPRPMHISTIACHTNSFHLAEPSLSEAFMRSKNSNVVTYWGSSSYGWTTYSRNVLGPSENLILYYYDLLLKDNNEFKNYAELTTKAKMKLKNIDINYSDHWLFFSVNSMGDPELPVFTRVPKEFNKISLEQKNDNSPIIKFNENKVNVTIYECTNTIEPYYKIYKNISDSCIVDNNMGSYIITLSKPNYVPHTIYLSASKIQNKTFIGNNDIYSEKLNIGYNIVDSLPHGNVTMEKGKISLNSSKGTFVKNGFLVNIGAKLYIK